MALPDHPTPDLYEALTLMREAEAEIGHFIASCADLINCCGLNDQSRAVMAETGSGLSDLAQHLIGCDRNNVYANRLREMLR